jgi:hypothetical protein
MKVKNISYPYPVLKNADDVAGEFNVRFFKTLRRDKVELRVAFDLKNKTLEQMVSKGQAVFTVEVECNSTFFRQTFTTGQDEAIFEIPAARLREQVVARFFVRALKPIKKYASPSFHPDYKGIDFDIKPGDILAIGGLTVFIAEKDFDPLRPAVSSFMAIKQGDQKNGPMFVDYSDDVKIVVRLSKSDWNKYQEAKNKKWVADIIHSSIVLPVLTEAIVHIRDGNDEMSDAHWFQRLQVILQQQNLPDDDPLYSAQKILRFPVERFLESVCAQEDSDNDD